MKKDHPLNITNLSARLSGYRERLRLLLQQMQKIKQDKAEFSENQLKTIKEEINKVGSEIDSIKKQITLLDNYNIN